MAPSRVVIPISVQQKYGDQPLAKAIAVPVYIASPDAPDQGQVLPLLLDTGSTGVSIFTSALNGVSLPRQGAIRSLTYGGGDVFVEQSADAIVGLGDARTAGSIRISLVDSTHCATGTSCASSKPGYLTSQGFYGILGIGTRGTASDVYSPITQLPSTIGRKYVVRAKAGELIVGATDADLAGFATHALGSPTTNAMLPNGSPAFDDRDLPICVGVAGQPATDCVSSLIDSGTWFLFFAGETWGTSVDADGSLHAGTVLESSFPGVFDWKWNAEPGMAYVESKGLIGGFNRIYGMPFFNAFDVAYDLDQGTIGVRPSG